MAWLQAQIGHLRQMSELLRNESRAYWNGTPCALQSRNGGVVTLNSASSKNITLIERGVR
ncbi:MAG: hypothetical protein NVS3B5_23310 [Sphingomicrobium sp.]